MNEYFMKYCNEEKALIASFHNVNIGFIVVVSNIYRIGKKKMSEINVKVCESTNCCYLKTCKKYQKQKEKQNENKSDNLN